MRNHLGKASVAQSLDGWPSGGEPAFPRNRNATSNRAQMARRSKDNAQQLKNPIHRAERLRLRALGTALVASRSGR